jgi:site-specific recombinase XerD
MGVAEVEAFLSHLAVKRTVSASTQNQAFNALIFLFREVLRVEISGIKAKRARVSNHMPVVLPVEETKALLTVMEGAERLQAGLLYGCGLRLMECLRLRAKDVDLLGAKIEVRDGKGGRIGY